MIGFRHIVYQIVSDYGSLEIQLESPLTGNEPARPGSDCHWAQLERHQCRDCPYQESHYCPVAINLQKYIDVFSNLASFDLVEATVVLDDKIRVKGNLPAQQLLSSIIGMIIANSDGCSRTHILKPMVAFHRPFASQEESIYRSIANAAITYHLQPSQDISLEHYITSHYENLRKVNIGLVKRLQDVHPDWEAVINAIVNLDLFVKEILYNAKNDYPDLNYLRDLTE
jgi:hypothetical protein